MKKKRILIAVILLVVAILFIIFELNFLFSESFYSKKGSLKYYLTFPPKLIRNAPIINNNGDVDYSYSVGDGVSPQFFKLSYLSQSSSEDIAKIIESYLSKFRFVVSGSGLTVCDMASYDNMNGTSSFEVYVCDAKRPMFTRVVLTYYPKI
ncbi:MAG: hypothetical protein CSA18_05125 [Deltaproteobacteria bacterium]|nr:MAG: hypothetical protein CSA18_05125 [Deltaproteobacteria bacterium]